MWFPQGPDLSENVSPQRKMSSSPSTPQLWASCGLPVTASGRLCVPSVWQVRKPSKLSFPPVTWKNSPSAQKRSHSSIFSVTKHSRRHPRWSCLYCVNCPTNVYISLPACLQVGDEVTAPFSEGTAILPCSQTGQEHGNWGKQEFLDTSWSSKCSTFMDQPGGKAQGLTLSPEKILVLFAAWVRKNSPSSV